MSSESSRPAFKPIVTLMDLLWLVFIFIILMAILLPMLGAARERGRREICAARLRDIGTALQDYHTTNQRYPSGWGARDHYPSIGPNLGWQTSILKQLGETQLADEIGAQYPAVTMDQVYTVQRMTTEAREETYTVTLPGGQVETRTRIVNVQVPVTEERTRTITVSEIFTYSPLFNKLLPQLRCPSDTTPSINTLRSGLGTSNYSGNFGSRSLPRILPDRMSSWWPGAAPTADVSDGVFWANNYMTQDQITDGLSNTLLVSERCITSGAGLWFGVVRNCFENDQVTDCSHGSRPNFSYSSYSSLHPGGIVILKADGSTSFLANSVESSDDPAALGVFQKLGNRQDLPENPPAPPAPVIEPAPAAPAPPAPVPAASAVPVVSDPYS